MPDGTVTATCPLLTIDPQIRELCLTWFPHFQARLLPVAGGLLDQSQWYLEAMECIDQERRLALRDLKQA